MSRLYRSVIALQPRAFREEYGEDMAALFDDLVADRGRSAAWAIAVVDLLVTLPRNHLERLMNHRSSTATINATIIGLTIAGLGSILVGLYPGVLLLGVAAALAIGQRSALARAMRSPDRASRTRRLRTAAVLGLVFVGCYATFVTVIGEEWTGRETVLAVIGTASMIGAVAYLIAGIATPGQASGPSPSALR